MAHSMRWTFQFLCLIPRISPFLELADVYKAIKDDHAKFCDVGDAKTDVLAPKELREAMTTVMKSEDPSVHQSTNGSGNERLRKALSRWYEAPLGRALNPEKEIFVTVGVDESLECIMDTFLDFGDQVILIEPSGTLDFLVIRFQGIPVHVALKAPLGEGAPPNPSANDWVLDPAELRSKFNHETKLLFLENPHGPLGKVYSKSELEMIAKLCEEFQVYAIEITDDEHFVYEESGAAVPDTAASWLSLPRLSRMPGMGKRTMTVSSMKRTFGATGWSVGWILGEPELLASVHMSQMFLSREAATPEQETVAVLLEELMEKPPEKTLFAAMRKDLRQKREVITNAFLKAGLRPFKPAGGWNLVVDVSKVDGEGVEGSTRIARVFRYLAMEKHLVIAPMFCYYGGQRPPYVNDMLHVCFNRNQKTIDKAASIVETWGQEIEKRRRANES